MAHIVPERMIAIEIACPGNPEVLQSVTRPVPSPETDCKTVARKRPAAKKRTTAKNPVHRQLAKLRKGIKTVKVSSRAKKSKGARRSFRKAA